MNYANRALVPTLTVLALVACMPVLAQTARDGGSGNAQLLQQMQQLASERTALQAENARMKRELAEMIKQRDALQAAAPKLLERANAADRALQLTTAERGNLESELTQTKTRMQELVARFRETAQALRDVETERASFKQSLTEANQQLVACNDKNAALFALNGEVLTKLEDQGFWSRASRAEPFTRIKRTQLENLVDEYAARAQEQRISATP